MFGGSIFGSSIFGGDDVGNSADLSSPIGLLDAHGNRNAGAVVLPSPVLFAVGHDSTGENSFVYTAPSPVLAAQFGGYAELEVPRPTLSVAATFTAAGNAALAPPIGALVADGRISGSATAALRTPIGSLIGYFGGVAAVTVAGRASVRATGLTGSIGGAAVVCPLFELTASGTAQNHGEADLLAPTAQLGATAQAWLMAPAAKLTAVGTAVVTATFEAYAINLKHKPRPGSNEPSIDEATRYSNFPFTRIVRYKDSYYGMAADGLYLLEGTTDFAVPPTPVTATFKTHLDDFGTPQLKNVAAAYMGGQIGPAATLTLHVGEVGANAYSFTTPRGQTAQNHRQKFGRGTRSRYFALEVESSGALELDDIDFEVTKLSRSI